MRVQDTSFESTNLSGTRLQVRFGDGGATYSQDFVDAVKNNPVLESWGNKIVKISA